MHYEITLNAVKCLMYNSIEARHLAKMVTENWSLPFFLRSVDSVSRTSP